MISRCPGFGVCKIGRRHRIAAHLEALWCDGMAESSACGRIACRNAAGVGG